jgi:hypothetical protein
VTRRAEALCDVLRLGGPMPSRILCREDGRTTFRWHVDDDDDRHAEVTDSANSGDLLCLVRDHRRVKAVVLAEVGETVQWVRTTLSELVAACPNSRLPEVGW